MSEHETRPNGRPTNVRWVIFTLACGTSWVLYLHRYALGLIKPALAEQYGWSKKELGLLDSVFNFFYAAFQLPGGILADAFGAHYFLGGILLLWSVALGLHAHAGTLGWMGVVRAVFGTCQAGAYPALSRVTRNWFPVTIRTTVQGWVGVFFGRMGGVSANLLFATFLIGVLHFSWQHALYLFAGAGVVLAVVFLLLFRDSPRQHPLANESEVRLIEGENAEAVAAPPETLSVKALLARMSPRSLANLLALNLQTVLSFAADSLYVNWIPLFLREKHHLEYTEMGVYSMLPLLGGAFGGVCGGYLNDFLIRRTGRRRWARSGVGLAGKGGAAVLFFAAVYLFYEQPYLFCAMLFLVKLFGDWSLASTWGTVTDIGGRTSATVFAYNNAVASAFGIVVPFVFGGIADAAGWPTVFRVIGVIYALCAASWLLVNCTIPVVSERR